MKEIKELLDKTTDAWNSYFWESKFCQDKINFNDEVKTNYYGDILSYFDDTLGLLSDVKFEPDFQKTIFQATGILQIIYTHQDLMDELLFIFKLNESLKSDKNPNRQIRNELIGHPIRRHPRTNALISSVFLGSEFSGGNINYVLYNKDTGFSPTSHTYSISEIINDHEVFLLKYLTQIWEKIETVLTTYRNHLKEFIRFMNQPFEFEDLIKKVEALFEKTQKNHFLFKTDILRESFKRQGEHAKYKNVIKIFLDGLKEELEGTVQNIIEFLKKPQIQVSDEKIELKYIENESELEDEISASKASTEEKNMMSYYFSKLMDNHPIFGIDYFIRKFQKDEEILIELENMKQNISNELEYYASFEYIRVLSQNKGLLRK